MSNGFSKKVLPFYLCLVLAMISGFQLLGESVDYQGYQRIFQVLSFQSDREPTEPFFSLLRTFNDVFFDSSLIPVYFISAFLALLLKWKAITRLSDNNDLFVFILQCFAFFLLHEYTQIRAACSIGVFFLLINDLNQGKTRSVFLKYIIAVCFHYSAVLILVFLLYTKVCKSKKAIFLFPFCGFLFSLFFEQIAILSDIRNLIYFIQEIVGINKSGNISSFMSPLNVKYLMLFLAFSFYLIFIPDLDKKNILLAKTMSFGLCAYYWLNPLHLPVISVRLAEFYTSIFVIFFMNTTKYICIKEKQGLISLPVLISVFYSFATARTAFPK